jgi:hypothetical protein
MHASPGISRHVTSFALAAFGEEGAALSFPASAGRELSPIESPLAAFSALGPFGEEHPTRVANASEQANWVIKSATRIVGSLPMKSLGAG